MNRLRKSVLLAGTFTAGALLAATGSAGATPLTVISYDMINGGTSSLSSSLRDDTYTGGSGNPAVNYSSLAGGKGDLADGIFINNNWDTNPAPYVGWSQYNPTPNVASPVITFHFGSVANITGAHIYTNWQYSPGSVDFSTDGGHTWTNRIIALPAPSANVWINFSDLGLTGDVLTLRLNDRANNSYPPPYYTLSADWILIQEVTFDGTPAIPEPDTYAMLLAGLGLLGLAARRRKQNSA
jgi:hypothetical protein